MSADAALGQALMEFLNLRGGSFDPRSTDLNTVMINGLRSPGLAKISGASRPYKWDINEKSHGRGGAVMNFWGTGLCRFTLTLVFWEAKQFQEWSTFKKVFEPPKKPLPLAAGISHPILAELGVTKVIFESVGQITKQDNGTWTIEIACCEWVPQPKEEAAKPRSAVPSVANAANIMSPRTAADIALEEHEARMIAARTAASQ